ncbi:MAG: hypothetical protein ABSA77_13315, partial [Thermoguttaceae bacterium]
ILILDTCYAGGQGAGGEKGPVDPAPSVPFNFLDDYLGRTKGIGQTQIVKLASAMARQIALIRQEGDFSVMTHFLLERLREGEPLTVPVAYEYVKDRVPAYTKKVFHVEQTPVLVGDTTPPIYLRP